MLDLVFTSAWDLRRRRRGKVHFLVEQKGQNSHVKNGSTYTNGIIKILINASFYIKRVFFMNGKRLDKV